MRWCIEGPFQGSALEDKELSRYVDVWCLGVFCFLLCSRWGWTISWRWYWRISCLLRKLTVVAPEWHLMKVVGVSDRGIWAEVGNLNCLLVWCSGVKEKLCLKIVCVLVLFWLGDGCRKKSFKVLKFSVQWGKQCRVEVGWTKREWSCVFVVFSLGNWCQKKGPEGLSLKKRIGLYWGKVGFQGDWSCEDLLSSHLELDVKRGFQLSSPEDESRKNSTVWWIRRSDCEDLFSSH